GRGDVDRRVSELTLLRPVDHLRVNLGGSNTHVKSLLWSGCVLSPQSPTKSTWRGPPSQGCAGTGAHSAAVPVGTRMRGHRRALGRGPRWNTVARLARGGSRVPTAKACSNAGSGEDSGL